MIHSAVLPSGVSHAASECSAYTICDPSRDTAAQRLWNEPGRQWDGMSFTSVHLAQVATILVGEGQPLPVSRDRRAGDSRLFRIRRKPGFANLIPLGSAQTCMKTDA